MKKTQKQYKKMQVVAVGKVSSVINKSGCWTDGSSQYESWGNQLPGKFQKYCPQ